MAALDNRPQLGEVKERLTGLPNLSDYPDPLLQTLLDASISDIEDQATTRFNNARIIELYDGNSTNQITLRKRPALKIEDLTVETPILGFIRVYTQDEIKLYRKQGMLKVFTYKLAVEQ